MFQKQRKSGGGDFGITASETLPGLSSIKKPNAKQRERNENALKKEEKEARLHKMMENQTTTLMDQVAGICGCF